MKENFNKAIHFTLNWETGFGKTIYTNNPQDPGGETKWGISKKAFPELDIKNLTKDQAVQIYKSKYWNMIDADTLPNYLDIVSFDIAVVQGPKVALKCLDRLKDFARYIIPNEKMGALFLIIEAIDRLDDLTLFNTFGKGWTKRRISLAKYILSDCSFLVYDD